MLDNLYRRKKRKFICLSKYRPSLWPLYSQEAIAQDGAPQSEPGATESVAQDADQSTAPLEVQDDVSLILIISSTLQFCSKKF